LFSTLFPYTTLFRSYSDNLTFLFLSTKSKNLLIFLCFLSETPYVCLLDLVPRSNLSPALFLQYPLLPSAWIAILNLSLSDNLFIFPFNLADCGKNQLEFVPLTCSDGIKSNLSASLFL